MGWHFDLKYANVVTYLTNANLKEPPRLTRWQLSEFLGSLQGGVYGENSSLISDRADWLRRISDIANESAIRLERYDPEGKWFVPPSVAAGALAELRAEFSSFSFYALAVSNGEQDSPLRSFAKKVAYGSDKHGLVLIPDLGTDDGSFELFDPTPVTRKIVTRSDSWPGMLFWDKSGAAAFAPLNQAGVLYRRLMWAVEERTPYIVTRVLENWDERQDEGGVKRIFHLSDLHFGEIKASENQAYLLSHLQTKLDQTNRVVITGDLFNNPTESDAAAFHNFRRELFATTGKEAILVPGNHDQKVSGNSLFGFGRKLDQLSKLEWSSVVVDDDLECVFFCFDSSRDPTQFARGKVTKCQMLEVATTFETRLGANPRLADYLSVALVHHHPYSFETNAETWLQKGLKLLGLSDEDFLKMDDADEFLSWCAGRRIPLVLHGHKHVARHVKDQINWTHGKNAGLRDVVAVGCGTSLGIEGYPLSYNIVEWNPNSAKWTTSFFSDRGDGSGFEEVFVTQKSVPRA